MKKSLLAARLPLFAAALGAVGFGLRRLLYAMTADAWGLLPWGHPLEALLWLVTAAALAGSVAGVWGLDGSNRYADNFSPSPSAALGHILAAAGIGLTALLEQPPMGGALGTVWRVLALASVPCLAAAGLARKQGRRPFFLLHMTVCLFLVVHIVNQYRSWSGNPQLQDYAFSLFGQVAMVFFAYYTAAFDVGLGKRRMQLGMGLAAVYLNLTGLSWGDYPLVCLGCLAWAFTDLCALTPKPRPKKTESEPNVS